MVVQNNSHPLGCWVGKLKKELFPAVCWVSGGLSHFPLPLGSLAACPEAWGWRTAAEAASSPSLEGLGGRRAGWGGVARLQVLTGKGHARAGAEACWPGSVGCKGVTKSRPDSRWGGGLDSPSWCGSERPQNRGMWRFPCDRLWKIQSGRLVEAVYFQILPVMRFRDFEEN